jgi:hypothetical protein
LIEGRSHERERGLVPFSTEGSLAVGSVDMESIYLMPKGIATPYFLQPSSMGIFGAIGDMIFAPGNKIDGTPETYFYRALAFVVLLYRQHAGSKRGSR